MKFNCDFPPIENEKVSFVRNSNKIKHDDSTANLLGTSKNDDMSILPPLWIKEKSDFTNEGDIYTYNKVDFDTTPRLMPNGNLALPYNINFKIL